MKAAALAHKAAEKPAAPKANGGLRIGDANDAAEHEADRIADAVLSRDGVRANWSFSNLSISPVLRRKCAECEEEEKKTLRRKAAGADLAGQAPPQSVHEVLRSPGEPLDAATRAFFEPRFGADFERVRIHADRAAAQSARDVSARAYALGDHIVLGAGADRSPRDADGLRLMAHELAHTLQRQPARLSRQLSALDELRVPDRELPPRKTPSGPSLRKTDVPLGVTPCLSGAQCEPPVKGSATDFGRGAAKSSAPRQGVPRPAPEVRKAAESLRPGVMSSFFQVSVRPGLSDDVAAQVNTCSAMNVSTSDPQARCMEVPEGLEKQAALFNAGRKCLDPAATPSAAFCDDFTLERDWWANELVSTMVHEATHVEFGRHRPAQISGATNDAVTLHELSELAAQFSEFPIHFDTIHKNVAQMKPDEAARAIETSHDAWVQMHIESQGEGVRGMLTKLRCVNPCDKVQSLILSLMNWVTAQWPAEVRDALVERLSATPGLDWPQPPPSVRPPEPEHPKQPPLYRPRGDFNPEILKSTEDLP